MEIIRIPARRNDTRLRVAVYCRVSTSQADQEESLDAQCRAYLLRIRERPDQELVEVYADSVSGLVAEKRPEFMRMIRDAQNGRIDRILCKSVSRFSRNVSECKRYVDLLLEKHVAVEFEKEGLSTDDPSSSFLFSLMAAIAERESQSISENVKWGYRERFRRGVYNLGNNRILGYDCVQRRLVPNKHADSVRRIYSLYLAGNSIEAIRRALAERGIVTKRGKPLSHSNILYILKNETYQGDKLLQKTPPRDLITKRPIPGAAYESFYLENDHEAIVSKDTWSAVQQRLQEKKRLTELVGRLGGRPGPLYGKVFCGLCGEPMTRRTVRGAGGAKRGVWVCRGRKKGKAGNGCGMRIVSEEELTGEICAARIFERAFVLEEGLQILGPAEEIAKDHRT